MKDHITYEAMKSMARTIEWLKIFDQYVPRPPPKKKSK